MTIREPREGQKRHTQYLVLNRSCADLYEEIAQLFADRPYIKVIVDRRQGKGAMDTIPVSGRPRARKPRGKWAKARLRSVGLRKEAS